MWLAVSTSIATEVKEDADIVCKRQLMIEMQYGKGSQSYAGKADQTYIHTCWRHMRICHEMQVSGHMRPRMIFRAVCIKQASTTGIQAKEFKANGHLQTNGGNSSRRC